MSDPNALDAPDADEIDFAKPHVPRRERRAAGRERRERLPLDEHRRFEPSERDPIAILEEQGRSRVPGLLALRHTRMAASPFAFYRGAAAIMARDLREHPHSGLITQLCGDAHLSNVGFFASPERSLVLDVNDFDETSRGPFEWDVKRMAASFELASRERGFDDAERQSILRELGHAYSAAMHDAARTPTIELFMGRIDAEEVLERIRDRLPSSATRDARRGVAKIRTRDSRQAVAKLAEPTDDGYRFRSDPPLLVPVRQIAEHTGTSEAVALSSIRRLLNAYIATLDPQRRRMLERFRMVDAAMKVVGVGSVGTRAWLALFVGNGRNDVLVLQAKEAQRSVLDSPGSASAWSNEGERVVRGQRVMQALGDHLLGWTRGAGFDGIERDYYVRQFRDWKGSASPEELRPDGMRIYAEYCGLVLARAHARGADAAEIAGYVGRSTAFPEAIADFAAAYADRTETDHRLLLDAIARGRLVAVSAAAAAPVPAGSAGSAAGG